MKISPLKAFRSPGILTLFIPAVGYSEDSEPKKLGSVDKVFKPQAA